MTSRGLSMKSEANFLMNAISFEHFDRKPVIRTILSENH